MTVEDLKGIVHSDPEIMGGTPVFVGTRVPLQNLVDALEGGESMEDFLGCMAESMGQNGASQQQAVGSVTRGDRRRRELEARKPSPPLDRLLLGSLSASGGNWWSDVGWPNHSAMH